MKRFALALTALWLFVGAAPAQARRHRWSFDAGTLDPKGDSPNPSVVRPQPMSPEVKALVNRLQAFYEKTQDFSARFKQEYVYKAFKRTQVSTGTVLFKKPALLRWEYKTPSEKTFLLANDKVYTYDPSAMLLTKAAINTSQLSASVTFLIGKGKLADEFYIAKVPCEGCQGALLELSPKKPDPRFRKIRFEVDPKSAQVLRSVVFDPSGDENAIAFEDLKTNVGLADGSFKLTPPEGTQVQDFTQPK